jgi:hypothetical protein
MSDLIIKRDIISFKNILMTIMFLTMTVLVTSVKAEDLTVYSTFGELVDVPNDKADYRIGHLRLRESELSFTENGDVIGHAHLISFVTNYDKKTRIDTRKYFVLVRLPEGTIWLKDVVKVPNKAVKAPQGYKFSGVILGGTQGYKKIGGTFESQMAADGKAFVSVYHINRPKKIKSQ